MNRFFKILVIGLLLLTGVFSIYRYSKTLHFLDLETFMEIYQIEVTTNDIPVTGINELEYIKG
ncbi:MAG TPA: hypothetical protein ENG48_04165 [Candidatus Atribacteria bacterium]|nr:MAG: hypothetical protein DRH33_06535 [Candidatus Nealsonbacteria bacterium]HDK26272.1 hypothetical protein [Candidatus Atribacteria bacterium]